MCFLSAGPAQAQVRINLLTDCVDAPTAHSGNHKRRPCSCRFAKCVVVKILKTNAEDDGGALSRKSYISGEKHVSISKIVFAYLQSLISRSAAREET